MNDAIQQPSPTGTSIPGVVADGVTQTAVAIQAALDTAPVGSRLLLPPGVCLLNQALTITRSLTLEGTGLNQTTLQQTVPNIPVLTVSAVNVHVTGFTVRHSGTAVAGGDGLIIRESSGGALNAVTVMDVAATHNWRGFVIGGVAYSQMAHVWSTSNNSHGFEFLYEALSGGLMQWDIFNAIAQFNLGAGFYGLNTAGANGIGPWITESLSFANEFGGFSFNGTSGFPVSDIRLLNVISSTDNRGGIYLNTYGGTHILVNPNIENAGLNGGLPMGSTGASSVATHTGHGLEVTVNNLNGVMITGGTFWNNSWSGLHLVAPSCQLIGGQSIGNGKAFDAAPDRRAGVYIGANNVLVSGHHFHFVGDGSTLAYIERFAGITGTVIGFNSYAAGLPPVAMQAPGTPGGPPRSGQVVIAETDNTATITLTPAEPDAAYLVQATANGATPGAAPGALTVVGTIKAAGNFQLVLSGPPGAGKNVVYDWMVHR